MDSAFKQVKRLQESTPKGQPYWKEAAEILSEHSGSNYTPEGARSAYRRWLKRGEKLPQKHKKAKAHPQTSASVEIDGDTAEADINMTYAPDGPLTIDDIRSFCQLDDEWAVEAIKPSSWRIYTKKEGHVTNYSIKASFKRKTKFDIQSLVKRIQDIQPVSISPPLPIRTNYLLEVNITDIHFGKEATRESVGSDYSVEEARDRYNKTIGKFLSLFNLYQFEKVLFVVGHDLLQMDNLDGTTTAGTPVDSSVNRNNVFNIVGELICESINKFADLSPVDVLMVPGNHDENTTFFLGKLLEAYYRNTSHVSVLNTNCQKRWYYSYGNALVLHTHSHRNPKDLPSIMAIEAADQWGKARIREAHLGHKHSQTTFPTFETTGVVVRELGSLSSADKWHYDNGYVGQHKVATSFVWQKTRGLDSIHYYYHLT
jgi:hypothetical protein